MGAEQAPGSSRALRLDPHALPARYVARDGGADGQIRNIELDRERVVLRRAVCGIPMKVDVRIREFLGVTLRTLPPDGDEPAAVAVMLEHRDSALSVPLFVADAGCEVMAEWKSWSQVLGVPLLVDDGDGALREPLQRLGKLGVGPAAPRKRRRAAVRWRRPAILMRRKPGRPAAEPVLHRGEREIIARD